MNTIIRKATIDDYPGICAVVDQVDELHRERYPNLYRKAPDGVIRPPEYIAGLIEDASSLLLVAEQEGDIVGVMVAYVRDTPPVAIIVPRRYGTISDVVVRRDRQRQGIALALMESAEAWARASGAGSMELNVYCFNEGAIRFYEGLGYEALTQKMAKNLE